MTCLLALGRVETVADVAHGTDQMFVFAAQLGAQATDVHVDGTGAAVIVVSPHLLQELRAREHTAGMLHQILQQFESLYARSMGLPCSDAV